MSSVRMVPWEKFRIPSFTGFANDPKIYVRTDIVKPTNSDYVEFVFHECSHVFQQRKEGRERFRVKYALEWIYNVFTTEGSAYENISYEREARHMERFAQNYRHASPKQLLDVFERDLVDYLYELKLPELERKLNDRGKFILCILALGGLILWTL